MKFLSTNPSVARALTERNYEEPTPVQTAVLADEAAGRDLLVSAQTGSGKTVAYGLAIAKDLLGEKSRFEKAALPLALIVAPRENSRCRCSANSHGSINTPARALSHASAAWTRASEQRELAAGAHIVVGTPGRFCDHLRRGRLDVSELKAIVLDEADEMLDLGFREDLELILKTTPDTRRTLLFSATLPRGIVLLAKQYQKDAFRIEVAGGEGGHADIEYRAIRVAPHDVERAVVNVLRFFELPSTIVFCNTRNAVKHMQGSLLERGFSVVALSGELTQNERTHALQALRDGRARVCVATDVAARGIDLPNLDLVIHAELPNDPEVLQHRSGRTGRAGRKGVSVVLVPPSRRRRAELFFNQAGIEAVWEAAPKADDIRKLDQQRMLQDVLFTEQPTEDDLTLARALLAERSPEDIATALARVYRERLPSPEEVSDPGLDTRRPPREDRFEKRDARPARPARGDDRDFVPRATRPKSGMRDARMPEGSVWFRASVGRNKNAEARWLLPMICRRGGIDKQDIGAIRIFDTTSEFEISAPAAEQFAVKVKGPDKEGHIRIEAMPDGPQAAPAPSEKPAGKPPGKFVHKSKRYEDKPRYEGKPRPEKTPEENVPTFHGKPSNEGAPKKFNKPGFKKFDKPAFDKSDKPAFNKKPYKGGRPYKGKRDDAAPFAKPAFKGKPKKDKNHG